jgi:hypothetical protein
VERRPGGGCRFGSRVVGEFEPLLLDLLAFGTYGSQLGLEGEELSWSVACEAILACRRQVE